MNEVINGFDKDNLRVLEKGIFYSDELVEEGCGHFLTKEGLGEYLCIEQPPSPLLTLTLASNRILSVTPTQLLSSNHTWVSANSLKVNQTLDYTFDSFSPSSIVTNSQLPPYSLTPLELDTYTQYTRHKPSKIHFPSHLSEELAYILGVMYSTNASFSKNRVLSLYVNSQSFASKVKAIFHQLFNLSLKTNQGYLSSLILYSHQPSLFHWFFFNSLVDGIISHRSPLPLRLSPQSHILSYLKGLIDNSTLSLNPLCISLSSLPLARDTQQLAESLGIIFHLSPHLITLTLDSKHSLPSSLETLGYSNDSFSISNLSSPFSINPFTITKIHSDPLYSNYYSLITPNPNSIYSLGAILYKP